MDEKIQEDEVVVLPSETQEEIKVDETQTQDPLKTELEKVQKQGRTKREKLLFTKERVEQQLSELDTEEGIILDDEDDKPVTVGMLKKLQTQTATKSALQLADEINDETERELTKYHIENTIRPTGDPKRDLELAQVHVNAVRNKQIVETITNKPDTRKVISSGGVDPNKDKVEPEFSTQEQSFMRPPFNLTKEQVLASRKA